MLGRNVNKRWSKDPDGPTAVWGTMLDRLQSLNGLIVNLECCISSRGEKQPGRGFHFRADPRWAVPALTEAGTVCATLANNHVLDFGPLAATDTLDHLEAGGIATAGAGPDRAAAFAPALTDIGGLDVAVVAATDQAPSYAASENSTGTAYVPLDPDDSRTRSRVGDALERARELDPDLLIVSLHWGPNWETEPSETQQSFARWLIDHGADLIHGHSAHTIQGVERYRGRPIIYDAGDFLDDYAIKKRFHNDWSFLFELRLTDGTLDSLELTPVEISHSTVNRAGDEAATWLHDRMEQLSEPFGTTIERIDDGLRIPLAGC